MSDYLKKVQWLAGAIDTMKGHTKDEQTFLSGKTTLAELDLDSLDIVELQMMYEEDFKVELEDSLDPIVDVNDLINLLEKIAP